MGHVAENGEGDTAGKETRRRVDDACDDGIPGSRSQVNFVPSPRSGRENLLNAVMMELVVGAQGWQGSGANGVGKEDLSSAVNPCLRVWQFGPVWRDVAPEANGSSF